MDLATLQKKLNAGYYRRVSEFLCDLSLIQTNCHKFNGPEHQLSVISNRMMELGGEQLRRFQERLTECETNIPLLSSTDLGDRSNLGVPSINDDAESVATETTFSDFVSASVAAGERNLNAGIALNAFMGHQQLLTNPQMDIDRPPGSAASWNQGVALEDDLNISSSSSDAEEGEIME